MMVKPIPKTYRIEYIGHDMAFGRLTKYKPPKAVWLFLVQPPLTPPLRSGKHQVKYHFIKGLFIYI